MLQTPLITTVLEWERRLEIEEEKRKSRRYGVYTDFPDDNQPGWEERASFFARIFQRGRDRKAECCGSAREYRRETQFG